MKIKSLTIEVEHLHAKISELRIEIDQDSKSDEEIRIKMLHMDKEIMHLKKQCEEKDIVIESMHHKAEEREEHHKREMHHLREEHVAAISIIHEEWERKHEHLRKEHIHLIKELEEKHEVAIAIIHKEWTQKIEIECERVRHEEEEKHRIIFERTVADFHKKIEILNVSIHERSEALVVLQESNQIHIDEIKHLNVVIDKHHIAVQAFEMEIEQLKSDIMVHVENQRTNLELRIKLELKCTETEEREVGLLNKIGEQKRTLTLKEFKITE